MSVMKMICSVTLLGLFQSAKSEQYMAECVDGAAIASMVQTKGMVGGYTVALQTAMPMYDQLRKNVFGPKSECLRAASDVNAGGKLKFPKMHQVGLANVMAKGDPSFGYLYVFSLKKDWTPREYVGRCVPGAIVKSFPQTQGLVGLFTEALQKTQPHLYGDLKAVASTKSGDDCLGIVSSVNSGITGAVDGVIHGKVSLKQLKQKLIVHPMPLQDLDHTKGESELSYILIFDNNMWTQEDSKTVRLI
eukprot:TRINITY_DN10456_c0_g1_i1.p1 TRINITY_DN10456_c0_g1~~TRINITY_DN10456_c0_g1_i1.p1  ORF type:complete len:272 (-),score=37.36 TRINITY_DN10456_c0_g1_i1:144-884(-)